MVWRLLVKSGKKGGGLDIKTLPGILINDAIKRKLKWSERLLVKLSCYESPSVTKGRL